MNNTRIIIKILINEFITKTSSKLRGHMFKSYSRRSKKENGKLMKKVNKRKKQVEAEILKVGKGIFPYV